MGSESGENRSLEVGFRRSPKSPKPAKQPKPAREPKSAKQPRVRRERAPLGVVPSSVITGLVTGLALVGLAALALDGCANVRGTESCGSAGLPILIVILGLVVVLGGVLLRFLARTTSAMSISFLAVAFVAIVVGLFLLDAVDGWAALVIVPLLAIVGYVGSHAVMAKYVEPEAEAVSAPDRTGTSSSEEPGPGAGS